MSIYLVELSSRGARDLAEGVGLTWAKGRGLVTPRSRSFPIMPLKGLRPSPEVLVRLGRGYLTFHRSLRNFLRIIPRNASRNACRND